MYNLMLITWVVVGGQSVGTNMLPVGAFNDAATCQQAARNSEFIDKKDAGDLHIAFVCVVNRSNPEAKTSATRR